MGKGVVFDKKGSYVECTKTGDWIPLVENNGNYVLRLWVHKNQTHPF